MTDEESGGAAPAGSGRGGADPPEMVERFREWVRTRDTNIRDGLVAENESIAQACARRLISVTCAAVRVAAN